MKFEIDPEFEQKSYTYYDPIDILEYQSETYSEFFKNYLYPNIPCLIRNVTDNWESTHKWVKNNKPNLKYLQEKYGENEVTIYNCSERYFNSQKTHNSNLNEYIVNYWENPKEKSRKLLYLKDWHLKLQCRNDKFYEVPIYFASDWLNEYHTSCLQDDYRFVYMGPANTWTPFHSDVFTSFSWSANVCGMKKWIFLPPGEEKKLADSLGNLPYDITNVFKQVKHCEIIQHAGEAVFVPSGWYHQVWNSEDTISINHNWVNACNIRTMWDSLNLNLKNVEREIENCKDMENFKEHCQIMLQSLFGINHTHFLKFLMFIVEERIKMVQNSGNRTLFHGHEMGFNHIVFDLKSIRPILTEFLSFTENYEINHIDDIKRTLLAIEDNLVNI